MSKTFMLKINYKTLIYSIFLFFIGISLFSQKEMLINLDYQYETIQNKSVNRLKSLHDTQIGTPVNLPFIDDFSQQSPKPDTTFWGAGSNDVFVNNHLAMNMVTYGAATLDAIDEDGLMYDTIIFNTTYPGDELTSVPIILNESDQNVFLSFVYQAGGYGEPPDEQDSLVLQFYRSDTSIWETVWKAVNIPGDSLIMEIADGDTSYWKPEVVRKISKIEPTDTISLLGSQSLFKNVILPVTGSTFIYENFRFRFKNYYSVSEGTYAGRIGNCDFWHIDYVRMDRNRSINDTIIRDLAFIDDIDSIMTKYKSVPARHMNGDKGRNQFSINPKVIIKNNYDSIINYGRQIILRDEINDIEIVSREINSVQRDSISNLGTKGLSDQLTIDQIDMQKVVTSSAADVDTAHFTYIYVIKALKDASSPPDFEDRAQNDTLKKSLILSNYYAYDDGTPEMGYGLVGQGSQNGKVAVQFDIFKEDILMGVEMYFNKPFSKIEDYIDKSEITTFFNLTVWDDNDGVPGDTLYSREVSTVFPAGERYTRHYYNINDNKEISLSGKCYIGWSQIKEEFLNVGFDTYRHSGATFVNFGSDWIHSSLEGSLMIRPVFGYHSNYQDIKSKSNELKLDTYPNPVRNNLYLDYNDFYQINYSVTDIQGRTIDKGVVSDNVLDCSHLKQGLYIFTFEVNGLITHKKIIVAGSY